MKIYIASHSKELAIDAAQRLRMVGHEITSRWIRMPFNPTASHTDAEKRAIAAIDAEDVAMSDIVVHLSGDEKYSGGKFVETGIAIGLGRHVMNVGRRENMLMWHRLVHQFDSVEAVIEELKQW